MIVLIIQKVYPGTNEFTPQTTFGYYLCVFFFRLPRVTVRHEYIGLRSYQVSPFTSVQDVKQLLYEETNLPVKEQQLTHNGRVV